MTYLSQQEKYSVTDHLMPDVVALAPRPRKMIETGLSRNYLEEIVAKHLYDGGVQDLQTLIARIALSGPVLEEIIGHLRNSHYVEVRGMSDHNVGLRYALTDKGRALASAALLKSGYLGPAPITVEHYASIVNAQTVHGHEITKEKMQSFFSDVIIDSNLLNELGPAMHSGRPVFLYGPPGTGKTYIGQRLARLLSGPVLIPHAIAIGETTIQLFDPVVHQPIELNDDGMRLQQGFDPRLLLCEKPAIVSGGELTLDMLEIQYSENTKTYQAPLHLKATNGIYLIDDLGRQRVDPVDLFNRWIVPLENKVDYLNLGTGKRFPIPFDMVLLFSTNLNPVDLADDAFLRRIGHKIHFRPVSPVEYKQIWKGVCAERSIDYDADLLDFAINHLHKKHEVSLLPCHPRDLLGMALDQARYLSNNNSITQDMLEKAWSNYFISLDSDLQTVSPDMHI